MINSNFSLIVKKPDDYSKIQQTSSCNFLFVCNKYTTNVLCKSPFVSIQHVVCESFTQHGFDLVICFELLGNTL